MANFDYRDNESTFKYVYEEKPDAFQLNYKEHFHTSYELLLFMKGDADFSVEHSFYHLSKGDFLIIKPGQRHNIILKSQSPYERFVIRFLENILPPEIDRKLQSVGDVYNIDNSLILEELNSLRTYSKTVDSDLWGTVFKSELNIIISMLCSNSELKKDAAFENPQLLEAINFINDNLVSINKVEDISKGLGKSTSSIQKLFASNLDTSVMVYVRTKKAIYANDLLKKGFPAKVVYREAGFSDYSTFYRCYKKIFG